MVWQSEAAQKGSMRQPVAQPQDSVAGRIRELC